MYDRLIVPRKIPQLNRPRCVLKVDEENSVVFVRASLWKPDSFPFLSFVRVRSLDFGGGDKSWKG